MLSRTNRHQRGAGRFGVILLLVLLMAGGLAAANRQNLSDWWRLRQYTPPPVVAQLASQGTMTDYGKRIFYINKPSLEDKARFSQACPNNGGEQTIILGCYREGQAGIFLLDVQDARLDGVELVTAAHEMLHGAYERLSDADRRRIDALLLNYYNHELKNKHVADTIEAYKKSEPDALNNEMHSIFATEIAQLPKDLEDHYRRYFADRSQVVRVAEQYRTEFTSRETAIAEYDAQLASLKLQVENVKDDLESKESTIESQERILLGRRNSGDVEGYNAGVSAYNNLIDDYNAEVEYVKSLVSRYNQLVNARNAVAFEENQLYKALSTTPAPINR